MLNRYAAGNAQEFGMDGHIERGYVVRVFVSAIEGVDGGFGLFVNRRRGEISFACRQRSVTRINCQIIIFLVSVGNKNRRFRKFFVTRRLCVFLGSIGSALG